MSSETQRSDPSREHSVQVDAVQVDAVQVDAVQVDVAICGGGLAGLTFALGLRRELPELRVAVFERTKRPLPPACHKVGESSVELGSHYFGEVLGLKEHILERHLIKNGLRFFSGLAPDGGHLPLAQRTEIGPPELPRVPSYQLDRGRLEDDLRGLVEEAGAELFEGASVRKITLGEGEADHVVEVRFRAGEREETREVRARWVIDASGRRRLLHGQLDLLRDAGHEASAAWFRVEGKIDVAELVPKEEQAWHARDPEGHRYLSTNHLMGEGYWVWIIPLSTGHTSLGIVTSEAIHPLRSYGRKELAQAWLRAHEPLLAERIEGLPLLDFLKLEGYAYLASQAFSERRWACVGEAALFADPLYSPGSDFIALSNSLALELIREEREGKELAARAEWSNFFYLTLADNALWTYRRAPRVYGKPRVLAAKIYWDDFMYWAFLCQYFFQGIHRLGVEAQRAFLPAAERFAELNRRAQRLLAAWAEGASSSPPPRTITLPKVPSHLANLHLDLERKMSPEETLAYMEERLTEQEEVLGELLLHALKDVGPEGADALLERSEAKGWDLRFEEERLLADEQARGRRKRLSKIARDMERVLGRPDATAPGATEASLRALVMAAGLGGLAASSAGVENSPADAMAE